MLKMHTPGQWQVNTARQVAGCNGDIAITLPNGTIVAVAFSRIGKPDETLANAKLIAAAPELYKALKAIIEANIEHNGDVFIEIMEAGEAIAKAEGR